MSAGARIARARRVMLSGALGLMVMGAAPWSALAADASPPPEASADPTPDPTDDPTPQPTSAPTPEPTIDTAASATPGPSPVADETPTPTPDPTPTANPSPTPSSPPPSPTATIRALNLYRWSAMVRQYTNYWCVPAATQSMVNLVRGTSNRTYVTQKYYYKLTRQHNRYTYATKGNDPQGWEWSLRPLHARRCELHRPRIHRQDEGHQRDRRRAPTDPPPGRRHGSRRHPRLGRARLPDVAEPRGSRQADAPRPLRQRPARARRPTAGRIATSPSPSSATSSLATTSGSGGSSGKASGS